MLRNNGVGGSFDSTLTH